MHETLSFESELRKASAAKPRLYASCVLVPHRARATNGVEPRVEFCACLVRQHRLKGTSISWDILLSDTLCLYLLHVLYFKRRCCSNRPLNLWKSAEWLGKEKVSHSQYWVESLCPLKFYLVQYSKSQNRFAEAYSP